MRLTDFLDKGASRNPNAPCVTMNGRTRSYAEVQRLSRLVGRALVRSGAAPGGKVAVLAANDPVAFACVFGIAKAGAVWCAVDPGNDAAQGSQLFNLLECSCIIFQSRYAQLVEKIAGELPALRTLVCLDGGGYGRVLGFRDWLQDADRTPAFSDAVPAADDVLVLSATVGTTGSPKAVMLTSRNIETVTALTLMTFPFSGRPVYLALAPLTHAGTLLCLPVLALGGQIVILPSLDLTELLALIADHQVTHAFLPPARIYRLLDHPALPHTDLSSLQCLWYGAAPMSSARLAECIERIGPVMAQMFGQMEAPMMVAAMAPEDYFRADGSLAPERLASAGRPTPLTTVAIMDEYGGLVPQGERGEIVVRGPLVMAGYYRDEAATAAAGRYGWHHTGDIGYLSADNYLYVVDRCEDTIATSGFTVYSSEVELALLQHPAVLDCAVVGVPDDRLGQRVTAVIQPHPGAAVDDEHIRAFALERLDSIKAPRQVEVWPDLPRSTAGRVRKCEVRARLLGIAR